MLAKDHKMKDLWQPEMSSAGSKAAMKAHREGGNLDLWHPSASSAGNSAAVLAMRNKGLSPQVDRGITDTARTNSLLAATKSHNMGRQRSGSTPVGPPAAYPDSGNSAKNALNAATVSHRLSTRNAPEGWDSEANQAARIKNSNMDPKMFGEHPPVQPEVDEQKHQAALRASAVSMAKQMYDYQNRAATPSDDSSPVGPASAETAHKRNQSSTSNQPDLKQEAMKYIHLQDAAYKLAQERLAKVESEMNGPGRYREYYGYPDQSPKKSRLTIRGRGRKRASSEGDNFDNSDDENQARRIRSQMTQLSTAKSTVDDSQRQEDRARLLAAAEKRVHTRMHDMDEKVFQETGKVSQSMMDDWEAKALEKAEKDREERDRHPGKTHIGGGKWMDQADIEAIAAARLKPTLDEITDTAEKRRAHDEEIRRQRDEQETARMEQKIKDEQTKEEFKQMKGTFYHSSFREQHANIFLEEDKMKNEQTKAEFRRIKGTCCQSSFRKLSANDFLEQDKAAARKEKEERKAVERREKEEADERAGEREVANMERKMKDDQKKEEFETVKQERKRKDQEMKAEFKRIKGTLCQSAFQPQRTNNFLEQDKANARKEKEERKAAERREKEGTKVRKSEDARKSREAKTDETAAVAGGAALAEVASKVKTDDEEVIHDDTHAEPQEETTKDMKEEPIVEPTEKPTEEPKEMTREATKEETTPETKEKQGGRGMFDKIVKKLKGRDDEGKQADEPETAEGKRSVEDTTKPSTDVDDKADEHDERAAIPAVAAVGVGGAAAAGGTEEERATKEEEAPSTPVEAAAGSPVATADSSPEAARGISDEQAREGQADDEDSDDEVERKPKQAALALAGAASLGAGVAGTVAAGRGRRGKDDDAQSSEVSSLSTDDDNEHNELAPVTSPEHDGSYNFAMPSPTTERKKPDLERHISTIGSSGSNSEELEDSDDDIYSLGEGKQTYLNYAGVTDENRESESVEVREEPVMGPAPVEEKPAMVPPPVEKEPVTAPAPVEEKPVMVPPPVEEKPVTAPAPVEEKPVMVPPPVETPVDDKAPVTPEPQSPVSEKLVEENALVTPEPQSPVSPLRGEEERKILIVNQGAKPGSPHMDVGQRAAIGESSSATPESRAAIAESSATPPTVKTGPRDDAPTTSQKENKDKDKGVRGFFRKLTGRQENKLQKSKGRAVSGTSSDKSEKAFQGGAKYTDAKADTKDKDDTITPVTTTSAGKAGDDNVTPEHVGTDGAIGDSKHISGVEGNARASSPSSFKRYEHDLNDLDDVSSSGAEEEDLSRGRGGPLGRTLGLATGKEGESKGLEPTQSRATGDEQFEEARDTFDESLAPPPAFAGQAKTESPSRETRFREQL